MRAGATARDRFVVPAKMTPTRRKEELERDVEGYVEPPQKPLDIEALGQTVHTYPRDQHGEAARVLEEVAASPALDESHLAPDAATNFGWREETPMAVALDSATAGWRRTPDDPNVIKMREELAAHAGIPDLPVIDGKLVQAGDDAEIARAVELYERDGFVAMSDALTPDQLEFLRSGVDRNVAEFMEQDPHMGGRYTGRWGLEPGRYSFGSGRHLHEKEWCMLIDLSTCTPVVRAIYRSDDYFCWGAGGDFSLAGAVEYQPLHRDGGFYEGPAKGVTLNFNMVDLHSENGPIRQIPGSHRWDGDPPMPDKEPQYMKYSFVKPLNAGGVIFRDLRCWHGGSPNLSDKTRALPNVEYSPPPKGVEDEAKTARLSMRTMPYENWLELSKVGQHLSRYVVLPKGETPPQLFPHEWEGKAIPDRRDRWSAFLRKAAESNAGYSIPNPHASSKL